MHLLQCRRRTNRWLKHDFRACELGKAFEWNKMQMPSCNNVSFGQERFGVAMGSAIRLTLGMVHRRREKISYTFYL